MSAKTCRRCEAPTEPGRTKCAAHAEADRSAVAAVYARRLAAGFCRACETLRAPGSRLFCRRHLRAQKRYEAAFYRRARQKR